MSIQRFAATANQRPRELDYPGLTLIVKQSPVCGISVRAYAELSTFAALRPELRVLLVDVLRERNLSQRVGTELGVGHASPQVILVRDGEALWSESHFRISVEALRLAVEAAETATATRGNSLAGAAACVP